MQEKQKYIIVISTPIVFTALLVLVFWHGLQGMSAAEIVTYLPSSRWLAALALWGLYAVKALSVFFPVTLLFMAAGILFSPVQALGVGVVGVLIEFAVQYALGRFTGNALTCVMLKKFPKLHRVERYRCNNQLLYSYILRALGFLPADIVSWYLGSVHVPAPQFFAGSLLGFLPGLILQTLLGAELANGLTLRIALLFVGMVAVSLCTTLGANQLVKKLGVHAQK